MAKKKPAKPQKKDDSFLQVKYVVEIPGGLLNKVISSGCAFKMEDFKSSFRESLDNLKKKDRVSKDTCDLFDDILDMLDSTSDILDLIEDTWNDKKEICNDKDKKQTCKKEKKSCCKAKKKQTEGGVLTMAEKTAIKQLRQKGLSIKAIGKTIKRGEKVVANYVHELDKTKKRK